MTKCTIVPYAPDHTDRIVELSLDAWAPVFASFRAVLGTTSTSESTPTGGGTRPTSVRAALAANDTWVAITDDDITGFVNVVFDQAERSGEPARATYEKAGFTGCPQVWYAKQLD